MLNHITTVLINDWNTIPAGTFLSGGIYLWMAHIVTKKAVSQGGKIFWMMFSILLLRDILQSNSILYNSMTYVALGIFFTHIDLITNPIKAFWNNLKQRKYNKYKQCIEKNRFIEDLEAKEQREKDRIILEKKKEQNQARFINNLSKKLDSF